MKERNHRKFRPLTTGILVLLQITAAIRHQHPGWGDDNERGDVPGWVMITLMSAVLVAGLLALAGPALEGLFQSALNQVRQ